MAQHFLLLIFCREILKIAIEYWRQYLAFSEIEVAISSSFAFLKT